MKTEPLKLTTVYLTARQREFLETKGYSLSKFLRSHINQEMEKEKITA